jgi:hypothetical protein
MKKRYIACIVLLCLIPCFVLSGCAQMPKGFLRPSETAMESRQLQMKQYDTQDETKIISSVAGVLQDLGFTLDDSESELGLVSASKKADATNKGQQVGAFLLDMLAALGGNGSASATKNCDKEQLVKASVITKLSIDKTKIVVRVTFQRIVWNMENQIKLVESLKDPKIYQKFYDALSKAIFLEAQQI